jgi:hypothetical protein
MSRRRSELARNLTRAPRRSIFALALAFLFVIVAWCGAAASEAGLVIRHGDGGVTYAIVVFPEDEISSFELLDRSTISLATVAFGGLGEAVCTLDGEGCGLSDCRVRLCQTGDPNSPFWQFFRQDGDGAWVAQPLGASTSKVHDGDVDGWSWTGGDAGISTTTVTDIAGVLGIDAEALASVPEGETRAFTGSFDASGNRIEHSNSSAVSSWSTIAGVAALVVLAGLGLVLRRVRMKRAGAAQ